MKRKTREQKGITLIALIITIVVLLILAAVAISSISNDGIISKAQNAAMKYNEAQVTEQAMLKNYMDYLNTNGVSGEGENGGTEETTEVTLTLDKITITKEIESGSTVTETLTATLTNATGTLSWTSSNTSVATVSGNGNTGTVTLKAAGSAIITVSYGSYSATCKVTVTEKQVEYVTITLINLTGDDTSGFATMREENGMIYIDNKLDTLELKVKKGEKINFPIPASQLVVGRDYPISVEEYDELISTYEKTELARDNFPCYIAMYSGVSWYGQNIDDWDGGYNVPDVVANEDMTFYYMGT